MRPPIAVAISTRDRPRALEQCLRSLAAGRVTPAEVVVADQSDGAETREVVAAASGELGSVRYVRARPGGLGASQNDAVRAATRDQGGRMVVGDGVQAVGIGIVGPCLQTSTHQDHVF